MAGSVERLRNRPSKRVTLGNHTRCNRARLSGDVHVWGPRLELWGDQADYDAADGKLTVTGGRPVVQVLQGDWTGAVQGDTVTALQKPDRMLADGNTKGWIRFKDKPGKKKK